MIAEPPDVNAKAAFYLKHREQIEEWAALRGEGRRLLDDALVSRLRRLAPPADGDVQVVNDELDVGPKPRAGFRRGAWRRAGRDVAVCLGWNRTALLDPSSSTTSWPYLGVRMLGASSEDRRAVKLGLREQASALGWTWSDDWPCWRPIVPDGDGISVDVYADHCVEELNKAWPVIDPAIGAVLNGFVTMAAGEVEPD